MRGEGVRGCGVSANEYSDGAQINFGDLSAYLTYLIVILMMLLAAGGATSGGDPALCAAVWPEVRAVAGQRSSLRRPAQHRRSGHLCGEILQCKEISICEFPEKELRGLSPYFHIHVSVNDLYIPKIGPPIFLQQNMQNDYENI